MAVRAYSEPTVNYSLFDECFGASMVHVIAVCCVYTVFMLSLCYAYEVRRSSLFLERIEMQANCEP